MLRDDGGPTTAQQRHHLSYGQWGQAAGARCRGGDPETATI
jgi:hypothetical protein